MSVFLKDEVEFMSKHESLGGDPNVTFLNIINENIYHEIFYRICNKK